jgi:hypothetical protein
VPDPDLRTAAQPERWHLTERGALLYGDDSGGITVVGLAAWKDCPERTEAIRALSRWCDEAIASAAALAVEATEPPPVDELREMLWVAMATMRSVGHPDARSHHRRVGAAQPPPPGRQRHRQLHLRRDRSPSGDRGRGPGGAVTGRLGNVRLVDVSPRHGDPQVAVSHKRLSREGRAEHGN